MVVMPRTLECIQTSLYMSLKPGRTMHAPEPRTQVVKLPSCSGARPGDADVMQMLNRWTLVQRKGTPHRYWSFGCIWAADFAANRHKDAPGGLAVLSDGERHI